MREKLTRYIVLAMSICFIVVGSSRGEVKVVLKKAVNICLECIGIG
ncbi:CD1871A family CXXC motif-containing protein [Paraclostridium bifermentans]